MKKYRSQVVRRVKTDKQDAITICEYGLDYWYRLKNYEANGVIYEELKLLGQQYRNYMKMHIESVQNLMHLMDCVMLGIKLLLGGWNESSGENKLADFANEYWHVDNITKKSERHLEDAKSEVQHALRLLNGKRPEYPVFFDMEDADGYKAKHGMPSNQGLVDICKTFLLGVEDAGYYASLYASLSWLNNQLNSHELDRLDKWVAQWNASCSYNQRERRYEHRVHELSRSHQKQRPKCLYIRNKHRTSTGSHSTTPELGQDTRTYTIKKGDTLWDISKKYLGTGTRYP